ncbi:hypothetical protein ACWGI9_41885 [Streptomyces sp. NPDC054833]
MATQAPGSARFVLARNVVHLGPAPAVFDVLKEGWRILTKLRTDPARATHLFRALLVLTNIEATTDN